MLLISPCCTAARVQEHDACFTMNFGSVPDEDIFLDVHLVDHVTLHLTAYTPAADNPHGEHRDQIEAEDTSDLRPSISV